MARDFFHIFFRLKDYPDNYGPCRLWERPRRVWPQYYGSNYNPYQRARLRREVQPAQLEIMYRDKEVCNTLCEGAGIPVPKSFGTLPPTEEARSELSRLMASSGRDRLIVKPVAGNAGRGVMLAESGAGGIVLRQKDRAIPLDQFRPTTSCIVQEVLSQDPAVGQIAPGSINTLRLMTMLTRGGQIITIGASMRFGVGESIVDNWSAGGVAVGVDHERGRLNAVGYDKRGNRYTSHPVTDVTFSDLPIPHWEQAETLGHHVQRVLPFVRILGLDLAFTDRGVVLIEINSDADFVFQEQTSGPLLSSYRTWKAFLEYDLLYNQAQRDLYVDD